MKRPSRDIPFLLERCDAYCRIYPDNTYQISCHIAGFCGAKPHYGILRRQYVDRVDSTHDVHENTWKSPIRRRKKSVDLKLVELTADVLEN